MVRPCKVRLQARARASQQNPKCFCARWQLPSFPVRRQTLRLAQLMRLFLRLPLRSPLVLRTSRRDSPRLKPTRLVIYIFLFKQLLHQNKSKI